MAEVVLVGQRDFAQLADRLGFYPLSLSSTAASSCQRVQQPQPQVTGCRSPISHPRSRHFSSLSRSHRPHCGSRSRVTSCCHANCVAGSMTGTCALIRTPWNSPPHRHAHTVPGSRASKHAAVHSPAPSRAYAGRLVVAMSVPLCQPWRVLAISPAILQQCAAARASNCP